MSHIFDHCKVLGRQNVIWQGLFYERTLVEIVKSLFLKSSDALAFLQYKVKTSKYNNDMLKIIMYLQSNDFCHSI